MGEGVSFHSMVPRSLIGFAFLVWGSVCFCSRAAFSFNKQVIFRDINRNVSCFLLAATSILCVLCFICIPQMVILFIML